MTYVSHFMVSFIPSTAVDVVVVEFLFNMKRLGEEPLFSIEQMLNPIRENMSLIKFNNFCYYSSQFLQ